MAEADYYSILGVNDGASEEEISRILPDEIVINVEGAPERLVGHAARLAAIAKETSNIRFMRALRARFIDLGYPRCVKLRGLDFDRYQVILCSTTVGLIETTKDAGRPLTAVSVVSVPDDEVEPLLP